MEKSMTTPKGGAKWSGFVSKVSRFIKRSETDNELGHRDDLDEDSDSVVMFGSIKDICIADLIQHSCQLTAKPTMITVQSLLQKAVLYCENGNLVHAELDEMIGDIVVFKLLEWSEGEFSIQVDIESPEQTIFSNYTRLLREGAVRIDEGNAKKNVLEIDDTTEYIDLKMQKDNYYSVTSTGIKRVSESDSFKFSTSTLEEMSKDITIKKEYLTVIKPTGKSASKTKKKVEDNMANVNETLTNVMAIDGTIACALVDWSSGMTLGTMGSGMDVEVAAAGNTNVIRAKMDVMKSLKISGSIEDILITLEDQYHLIRILKNNTNMFLYVAIDRSKGNLGMARHKLAEMEQNITI